MSKKKVRESNIELLRILVMIGIVFCHIATKEIFVYSYNTISINRLWIQFLTMFGNVGNVCYILITGYFLIKKNNFEIKHILKIWLQIFFYSFLISLLFYVCRRGSLIVVLKSLMPISMDFWWFASIYFVLYLLSPYINKFLLSLNKKEYQSFLILILVLWSFLPVFIPSLYSANELIFFIMIYIIGAYLGKYKENFVIKDNSFLKLSLLFLIILYLSAVVMDLVGLKYQIFATKFNHFWYMHQFPMLITCIFIFLGFKNLKIKNSKLINKIAATTFGIYLIHEHPLIKIRLNDFLTNLHIENSIYLIPITLFLGLAIFVICSLIDLLRIKIFNSKIINKLLEKMENIFNKIIYFIEKN